MLKVLIPALAALGLTLSAANALTITNNDSKEHTIGVDMGNSESVHKIPAGKSMSLESECDDGCGVTGPWSFSRIAKTGDTIVTDGKPLVTVSE